MKNFQLLFTIILVAFSTSAQDVAMNTPNDFDNTSFNDNRFDTNTTNNASKLEIAPLLEETTYSYKYKGDEVLVVFTGDEHIEYFNNKEHFIKSTIEWKTEDECYMTLKESNLPDFPFRSGTKLRLKINKIKRGYIFYESTLGGITWTGKMKKK